ncbi:hypothetical protein O6H91_05G006800 [Diphasiastrum complanatum]|uniref:Uncharacterized protein n=1 Tax=Diphasiastrum complanatum TaxID=34168 RepID=A0ACC2DL20_DIPCM|nr:hypothetical protein O6H91_05G006800 [Diphasiastrum complanatum]
MYISSAKPHDGPLYLTWRVLMEHLYLCIHPSSEINSALLWMWQKISEICMSMLSQSDAVLDTLFKLRYFIPGSGLPIDITTKSSLERSVMAIMYLFKKKTQDVLQMKKFSATRL